MGSSPASSTMFNFGAWRNRKVLLMLMISTAILGFTVIIFWQFGEICPDGSYCHNFPSFKPAPSLQSEAEQSFEHSLTASLQVAPEKTTSPTPVAEVPASPEQEEADKAKEQADDPISEPSPSPAPALSTRPSPSPEPELEHKTSDPTCEGFPDTSNILLVMKTGASEAYSKVPTQLLTNLRCLDDFLIFSDMEQEVAGFPIQDSLDTVLPEAMTDNKDFDLYNRQKACSIDQETCNKNSGANTASEGWALDKYKNIHMAEKAYAQRPDYDWYLFVDADTYVLWGTLVEWLQHLDSSHKYYLGSVALLGGFPFAHGGSGYLVSKAMMRAFLKDKTGIANKWDVPVKSTCCGDYMFSFALKNETGIDVQNVAPTIHGEKPYTISYAKDRWCQPITTMHHIGSEEVSSFHQWEVERKFSSPVRIKDIYHRYIAPQLASTRADWDNFSDDTLYFNAEAGEFSDWQMGRQKSENLNEQEERAHLSFADCAAACHSVDGCMQFSFSDNICSMSWTIKHGHPIEPKQEGQGQRISGWDVERINRWVQDNEECGEINWPNP